MTVMVTGGFLKQFRKLLRDRHALREQKRCSHLKDFVESRSTVDFDSAVDWQGECTICGKRFHSQEQGLRDVEDALRKKHKGKELRRALIRRSPEKLEIVFQQVAGRPGTTLLEAVVRQLIEGSPKPPRLLDDSDDDTSS